MSLKISEILNQKKTFDFSYLDKTIKIICLSSKFNAYSRAKQADFANFTDWERWFLGEIILEWDLIGDDGKMCPCNMEILNALPDSFINNLLIKAYEEIKIDPNPDCTASDT